MRYLLLLLVSALAFGACLGGDKESPQGQSDYLEQLLEITTVFNRAVGEFDCRPYALSTGTCDRDALQEALAFYIKDWEQLDAPPELRAAEAAYLASSRDLLDFLAVPTEEAEDRVDEFGGVLLARERGDEWSAALHDFYGVRIFMFEGLSMTPAFCDGDTVAIKPPERPIQRWDVIVFEFPQDRERDFVKRVVGLPGETIAVHDGKIFIDGEPADGDVYALAPPNYEVEPLTIPPERYYVLGDNRRNSFDSHQWSASSAESPEIAATVPYDYIIGVLPADLVMCETPS